MTLNQKTDNLILFTVSAQPPFLGCMVRSLRRFILTYPFTRSRPERVNRYFDSRAGRLFCPVAAFCHLGGYFIGRGSLPPPCGRSVRPGRFFFSFLGVKLLGQDSPVSHKNRKTVFWHSALVGVPSPIPGSLSAENRALYIHAPGLPI